MNEALLVLKHFIDLSSRLLPILDELQRIDTPTPKDIQNKQKIITVYQSYHIDPQTSEILIGSNILQLIKESFHTIANSSSERHLKKAHKKLSSFTLEHRRLKNKWNSISAN
ncbi:MAG: hypothetical protein AB8B56_04805 [Crocinitomicaceae bacterium]